MRSCRQQQEPTEVSQSIRAEHGWTPRPLGRGGCESGRSQRIGEPAGSGTLAGFLRAARTRCPPNFCKALNLTKDTCNQPESPDLPHLEFDPALPVNANRERIEAAIAAHRVVIVSGETGSGKTTQLPKICLAMGRGRNGMIAHTQPRRLAATSVARRIASELQSRLGQWVG